MNTLIHENIIILVVKYGIAFGEHQYKGSNSDSIVIWMEITTKAFISDNYCPLSIISWTDEKYMDIRLIHPVLNSYNALNSFMLSVSSSLIHTLI